MKMQSNKRLLPPIPNCWYVLATSKELKKGKIITKQLAGEDLVIYRTESGEVRAIHPFCPHLGAHFGHGGEVEGENIRCPFHGFCFDTAGDCVKTAYGSLPSKRARVTHYPVHEVNGFILVYYHKDGQAPNWWVPEKSAEDWESPAYVEWEVDSHPQEITENSVDIGHFTVTHGFKTVGILEAPTTDGPYLRARYTMSRPSFLPKLLPPLRTEFTGHAHGLGYSFVEVIVPIIGMEVRTYVQPIPVEQDKIKLRLAVSTKKIKIPLIGKFLNWLLTKIILKGYTHDVAQDLAIWENKRYVDRPLLAKGDGPIGEYRLWVQQFYSDATLDTNKANEAGKNLIMKQ